MGKAKQLRKQRRFERKTSFDATQNIDSEQLIAFVGSEQGENDLKALDLIRNAQSAGQSVVLFAIQEVDRLATAANLPWLHELPIDAVQPHSFAWDPGIADAGGPVPVVRDGELLILGAGYFKWMEAALLGVSLPEEVL